MPEYVARNLASASEKLLRTLALHTARMLALGLESETAGSACEREE